MTDFTTVRAGLDRASVPMRLYAKAKALAWDPAAINLAQDRADWLALTDPERDLLLRLSAQFGAGEESVAADLLPLIGWATGAGRTEDGLFLASYLWEEAKHVEAFDRFLREVAQPDGPLDGYLSDAHHRHFSSAQPEAMARLARENTTEALVEAVVTYQMGTEGVLAETGYQAYYTVLDARGILPGMRRMVQNIQRDESRHVGYGVYLLSHLIAEDAAAGRDEVWPLVEAGMARMLMGALDVVAEMLAPYGDAVPFGVSVGQFMDIAQGQFQKRYARLEKARRASPADVRAGRAASADALAADALGPGLDAGLGAAGGDGAAA